MRINFFELGISFSLSSPDEVRNWLCKVVEKENCVVENLNYIFCSDDFLHKMNRRYLHHDTFTDVIAFDLSEREKCLEGDIYISVQRVSENSIIFGVPFQEELARVIVHGTLHLLGYKDNSTVKKKVLRDKEDQALSMEEISSFLERSNGVM